MTDKVAEVLTPLQALELCAMVLSDLPSTNVAGTRTRDAWEKARATVKVMKAAASVTPWSDPEQAPKDEALIIKVSPDWVGQGSLDWDASEEQWNWVWASGLRVHPNNVVVGWMHLPPYGDAPYNPHPGAQERFMASPVRIPMAAAISRAEIAAMQEPLKQLSPDEFVAVNAMFHYAPCIAARTDIAKLILAGRNAGLQFTILGEPK